MCKYILFLCFNLNLFGSNKKFLLFDNKSLYVIKSLIMLLNKIKTSNLFLIVEIGYRLNRLINEWIESNL